MNTVDSVFIVIVVITVIPVIPLLIGHYLSYMLEIPKSYLTEDYIINDIEFTTMVAAICIFVPPFIVIMIFVYICFFWIYATKYLYRVIKWYIWSKKYQN